ncbi:unnamed protein product [Trichogramma brassicae]|uniref:Uncharacterized protein n=1 Tax=Trichogramma brassicae TaxID=86971 RepID=A0A6H5HTV0_9HYME|nr:unnamed protein product [Trichogramma brassicae]
MKILDWKLFLCHTRIHSCCAAAYTVTHSVAYYAHGAHRGKRISRNTEFLGEGVAATDVAVIDVAVIDAAVTVRRDTMAAVYILVPGRATPVRDLVVRARERSTLDVGGRRLLAGTPTTQQDSYYSSDNGRRRECRRADKESQRDSRRRPDRSPDNSESERSYTPPWEPPPPATTTGAVDTPKAPTQVDAIQEDINMSDSNPSLPSKPTAPIKPADPVVVELDDIALEVLGEDPSKPQPAKNSVREELIVRWSNWIVHGLGDKLADNLFEKYESVPELKAQKLNDEFLCFLSDKHKRRDSYFVNTQNIAAAALSAIGLDKSSSSGSPTYVAGREIIRQSYINKGMSDEATAILMEGMAVNTVKQYASVLVEDLPAAVAVTIAAAQQGRARCSVERGESNFQRVADARAWRKIFAKEVATLQINRAAKELKFLNEACKICTLARADTREATRTWAPAAQPRILGTDMREIPECVRIKESGSGSGSSSLEHSSGGHSDRVAGGLVGGTAASRVATGITTAGSRSSNSKHHQDHQSGFADYAAAGEFEIWGEEHQYRLANGLDHPANGAGGSLHLQDQQQSTTGRGGGSQQLADVVQGQRGEGGSSLRPLLHVTHCELHSPRDAELLRLDELDSSYEQAQQKIGPQDQHQQDRDSYAMMNNYHNPVPPPLPRRHVSARCTRLTKNVRAEPTRASMAASGFLILYVRLAQRYNTSIYTYM